MTHFFKTAGLLTSLILFLCLGMSYTGAHRPIGDSLAVFRPLILIALICTSILSERRTLVALTTLLFCGIYISDGRVKLNFKKAEIGKYRVYQKNISGWNKDLHLVLDDIAKNQTDLVTFQELYSHNAHLLEDLKATHPYQHWCVGWGTAVASRFKFTSEQKICEQFIALSQIITEDGEFWIGSVHLNRPWPKNQVKQVGELTQQLKTLDAPIILGGDFNAVPWSATMSNLEKAVNGKLAGPHRSSFDLAPLFSLTIDHVIAEKGNFKTEIRPKFGSDHKGLIADVNPTPR